VELKGGVFKKFEAANLFQISCNDIVERFQIAIFLALIALMNFDFFDWDVFGSTYSVSTELAWAMLAVYLSECVVDWIKHAFILRFNRIPLTSYREFRLALVREVAPQTDQSAASSTLYPPADVEESSDYFMVDTNSICRRIGFVPVPLLCLCVRVVLKVDLPPLLAQMSAGIRWATIIGFFLAVCAFKMFLRAWLVRRALRAQRLEKFALSQEEKASSLPSRFERVGRS
jgi:Eukaryotic membrane protein family